MTDLETAIANLEGHSICLCKDGAILTDDAKGIAPMMKLISSGKDVSGYSVADLIVGRAAAMLFIKAGITSVYGKVMSKGAEALLQSQGIPCRYDVLTERIINREGTDVCPMEKTVADITDPNEAYLALKARIEQMRAAKKQ